MKYWNEFELVAIWVKSNYPKIFDEAMKDIADKEKQRELLKEIIQADEKDDFYDWDVTLNDGLNEEE